MPLTKHKQDWEELAHLDPYWAILSDPKKKLGRWDINEFFNTGDQEIESVMDFAKQLSHPSDREVALDFGCGVGRLTRALAKYFLQCYGVDISESMVNKAKELNQSISNCKFIANSEEHLHVFSDNYFNMIYSNIVLQHIPTESLIKSYIAEFIRTLKKNGLLVFQLPSHIPLIYRLQPRRRLYAVLKSLGFNERFLFKSLNLFPMIMNFVPEKEVIAFLNDIGANVLEVSAYSCADGVQSRTYYVTK